MSSARNLVFIGRDPGVTEGGTWTSISSSPNLISSGLIGSNLPSTFWCPTDSCRNRSIPVDSTGVRQESTGMEVNPEEWKSIQRNRSQSTGIEGQSRGMEVSPQEWRSIQRNGDQEGNPEEWKSIQKYKVNPEECKVNPQEWKSIEYKAIHRNTRSIHRDGEKTHNILHFCNAFTQTYSSFSLSII